MTRKNPNGRHTSLDFEPECKSVFRLLSYLAQPQHLVNLSDFFLEQPFLCRREGAHDPVVELHQLVDPPQQLEGGTNLLVGGLDVAWDGKLVSLPYSHLGVYSYSDCGALHLLDEFDEVPVKVDVHHLCYELEPLL